MDWLKQIAPTLATAIAGPLAGLAYSAIAKVLGIAPDQAKQMLDENKLTADQIAQVKMAEIELKKMEEQLGLNFAQLNTADRKSARDMQIATKSYTPTILAAIVIGGFAAITAMKVMGVAVASDPIISDLLTTLRDGVILVLSFYFGSSSGSQAKDAMIYNSTPSK